MAAVERRFSSLRRRLSSGIGCGRADAGLEKTPLNYRNRGQQANTPLSVVAKGVKDTPYEIKLPLIAFLKTHQFDEQVVQEAKSLIHTATDQQVVMSQIIDVEDQAFELIRKYGSVSNRDRLDLIIELRKQFVLNCIRAFASNRKVPEASSDPLLMCLMHSIRTCEQEFANCEMLSLDSHTEEKGIDENRCGYQSNEQQLAIPSTIQEAYDSDIDPDIDLSQDKNKVTSIIIKETCPKIHTPFTSTTPISAKVKPYRAHNGRSSGNQIFNTAYVPITPAKTGTLTTTHPLQHDEESSATKGSTVMEGDTPLDVVKALCVSRSRVSALKRVCSEMNAETPVRVEAQKRLSFILTSIPEEERSTRSTSAMVCSDCRTDEQRRMSRSHQVDGEIDHTIKTLAIPDTLQPNSPRKVKKRRLTSSSSVSDVMNEAPTLSPQSSEATLKGEPSSGNGRRERDIPNEDMPQSRPCTVRARRRGGSSALLAARAAPTAKRYVSRAAINARSKQSREKKGLREASLAAESLGYSAQSTCDGLSGESVASGSVVSTEVVVFKRRGGNGHKYIKPDEKFVEKGKSREEIRTVYELPTEAENVRQRLSEEEIKKMLCVKEFRIGQREAIEALNTALRQDEELRLLLSLPTGAGKSLVSQWVMMNALSENQLTIIVMPTIPLMEDQFQKIPILFDTTSAASSVESQVLLRKELIHSGLPGQRIRECLVGVSEGLIDALLVTPEQFVSKRLQLALRSRRSRPISFLWIDEAHCLTEWGHSFRPAYQKVLRMALKTYDIRRILLTTATASRATLQSISGSLPEESSTLQIMRPFETYQRQDISTSVSLSTDGLKDCLAMLRSREWAVQKNGGVTVIYLWMKYQAERAAEKLRSEFEHKVTLCYHSGMEETEKARVTHALRNGRCDFLVATQALGVGIDSHHITNVIHVNMPAGLEQYLQEIGRCNRSTMGAAQRPDTSHQPLLLNRAHLFLSEDDYWARYQQIASSCVDRIAVKSAIRRLLSVGDRIRENGDSCVVDLDQISSISQWKSRYQQVRKGQRNAANALATEYGCRFGSAPLVVLSSVDQSASAGPAVRVSVVMCSRKRLACLFGVRSEDDLDIILTLMETFWRQHQEIQKLEDVKPAICSSFGSSWLAVVDWWESRHDSGDVSGGGGCRRVISTGNGSGRLIMPKLNHQGVEIRCYERPLNEIDNPLFGWLAQFWTKTSSGIYKLRWIDVLVGENQQSVDLTAALAVDLDVLEEMLMDLASEYSLSIKPLNATGGDSEKEVVWIYSEEIGKSLSQSSVVLETMVDNVCEILERNNRVQCLRLHAAYDAFRMGADKRLTDMHEFVEKYFDWNDDMEVLLESHCGKTNCDNTIGPMAICRLEAKKVTSEVELARLKYEMNKLIDKICGVSSRSRKNLFQILGGEEVDDGGCSSVKSLDVDLDKLGVTGTTLARILAGMSSAMFSYESGIHSAAWKTCQHISFSELRGHCEKWLNGRRAP